MRRLILPFADTLLIALSTYVGYLLRFDHGIPAVYADTFPWAVVHAELAFLTMSYLFGLDKRSWRYASIVDMVALAAAVGAGTLTFALLRSVALAVEHVMGLHTWLATAAGIPRSIPFITGFVFGVLAGGIRFAIRIRESVLQVLQERGGIAKAMQVLVAPRKVEPGKADDRQDAPSQSGVGNLLGRGSNRQPRDPRLEHLQVLIVGAGNAGVIALREIRQATTWQVVGFIDDDRTKVGKQIQGVPVLGGREAIPRVAAERHVDMILIAMPSAPKAEVREIHAIAQRTGCTIRIVPALSELMSGRLTVNRLREVQIEDLLGREPAVIDTQGVSGYLCGRVVLVTGAGGSIGSELCRQVARFGPQRLILVGHGENSIFGIQGELKERFPDLATVSFIADVRDEAKVRRLFAEFRPEIVFHAAAHKHVPLMEANPDEAVTNNVFGTFNVARAAAEAGAERFVLISTDKAVNPVNCMGASKRVAEMIIQAMGRGDRQFRTRFVAVRFGNVLGSRGSVIPIFRRQIAAGGPVTVTHPDMKRYFMTIPEAVQLVLQAGAMSEGGEIYVLRMGHPVRIVDLAREMIRLSGLEPDVDIKIEFTGIRPGERLFEELHTEGETVAPTPHKDIVKLRGEGIDLAWLEHGLSLLREAAASGQVERVRALLLAMGREEPALDQVVSQAEAAPAHD